jgi:HEAT repeat protein
MPFEDVVRNLTNTDPKVRISAVRLLREARYPEAVLPLAALVNDPDDEIQLEAIAAELSMFLIEPEPKRSPAGAWEPLPVDGYGPAAFALGPFAAWPRAAPPELVTALLGALDDQHRRVRLEAIYTLGALARTPLPDGAEARLIEALEHPDPVVRAGAARVIGRLSVTSAADALFAAVNDGNADVRHAAMGALGRIKDERAVRALTEQFNYYGRGPGAAAALEALARIGHASSIDLFKSALDSKDPAVRRAAAEGLGRAGATSELETLLVEASLDESQEVRAAMTFAVVKLGSSYTTRLLDFLELDATARQVQRYLLELGPSTVPELLVRLHEFEDTTRRRVVEVLGLVAGARAVDALTPLTRADDPGLAGAAATSIERIRMTH